MQSELASDGMDTPLSKACQISIDSATFGQSINIIFQILEPMLEHFRWSESIDVHLPQAVNHMKTKLIQVSIQAQVCSQLLPLSKQRLNDFSCRT